MTKEIPNEGASCSTRSQRSLKINADFFSFELGQVIVEIGNVDHFFYCSIRKRVHGNGLVPEGEL